MYQPSSRLRLLLLIPALVTGALLHAPEVGSTPDPLFDRKKPTLDRQQAPPAPAPAPRRRGDEPAEPAAGTPRESAPGGDAAGVRKALGADDGSYRLGPRDILKVEVWNRAEIEYEGRPVTVTDRSTISLPLLDEVKVAGLTVVEAKELLTRQYDKFIIGPQVFIQMVEYNSRQVNVMGEVKSPGRYPLRGDMTVNEIIAEAGDLTSNASSTVRLIRTNGDEANPDVRDVDLAALRSGDASQNVRIEPDDVILVLRNTSVVYVTGMVKTEGYVEWEDGMTAQQAVILAGGLAEGSAGNRARLHRVVEGRSVVQKVNVKNQKEPVPVQPGDIIVVPRSFL